MLVSAQTANEPKFFSNTAIQCISPNGNWAVSEVYGTVVLFDLANDNQTVFEAGEVGSPYYNLGLGNVLSDSGTLLCSTESSSNATIYEDGQWKSLKIGEAKDANSCTNGITPDGSRICGNLGLVQMNDQDVTMIVPAIWDRQADGTFGDYVILPHPELDIVGRAPQYITAIAISDDGRTVVGQIVDCRGSFTYPIVYTQDEDGEWSYRLPTESLMNPDHVVLPEYPGDAPAQPDAKSFLDEAGNEAYQDAFDAYVESGCDWNLYPNAEDFLSEEQRAKYDAAVAEYNTAKSAWDEKYYAYDEAYWAFVGASPNFEFNQVAIRPDGKQFAMTGTKEDASDPTSWFPVTINNAWVIETETGAVTKYENRQLSVKAWGGDYLMAVERDSNTGCFNGYLLKDGEETSLYDFLCAKGDNIKEWVDLNMTHETESYDYETDQVVVNEVTYTGLPVASSDLSVIASWTESVWGDYTPESYLFTFSGSGALNSVAADREETVKFDANGNLSVGNDVKAVAVYNVVGACLLNVANPGNVVTCDLAEGIYIVKVTLADGSAVTVKAVK